MDNFSKNCSPQFQSFGNGWITFATILTVILGIISIILNLLFLCFVFIGIKRKKISKKRYSFFITRACADICRGAIVCFVTYGTNTEYSNYSDYLLVFFDIFSFWATILFYFAFSSVVYVAIRKPLFYTAHVSTSLCISANVFIWAFSLITASVNIFIEGTLFYPRKSQFCSFEKCQIIEIYLNCTVAIKSYVVYSFFQLASIWWFF